MYRFPFKNYIGSKKENSAPSEHSKEKKIQQKIKQHEEKINELKQELGEMKSRKMFKCENCSKKHPISKLTLLRPYWYETPHGCTGGDNWHRSDEYLVHCPKCDVFTRVLSPDVPFDIRRYDYMKAYNMKRDPKYMFGWIHKNENKFKEILNLAEDREKEKNASELIKILRKKEKEKDRRFVGI